MLSLMWVLYPRRCWKLLLHLKQRVFIAFLPRRPRFCLRFSSGESSLTFESLFFSVTWTSDEHYKRNNSNLQVSRCRSV